MATAPSTDHIRYECECGKKMKLPAHAAGKKARCPGCQSTFLVPKSPAGKAGPAKSAGGDMLNDLAAMEQSAPAIEEDPQERLARMHSAKGFRPPSPEQMKAGESVARAAAAKAGQRAAAAAVGKAASQAGGLLLGTILSAIGTAIGGGIWIGVLMATNFMVAYLAILMGVLSGLGMRLGTRGGTAVGGIVAACMAGGFLVVFNLIIAAILAEGGQGIMDSYMKNVFHPFDILFVLLAAGAAWKFGSGDGD